MKNPPTFFITGVQRSGTTLLSVLLARHSDIYLDENSIGFRLVSCFNDLKKVLPYNVKHSEKEIQSWLIENDYKGRLSQVVRPNQVEKFSSSVELIGNEIGHLLEQNGKKIFGDKVPNMEHFLAEILLLIPEAKFIHVVRDGRDVASSHLRRTGKNINLAANLWVEGTIAGLYNQAQIGDEKYLIIRFEDMVTNQKETLQKICNFLEIDYSGQLMSPLPSEKNSYVKSSVDEAHAGSFMKTLNPRQIKKVEKIQAALLLRMGYELNYPEFDNTGFMVHPLKLIWWKQKDNFKQLFRGKVEGMREHETVEVKVSFSIRVRAFFFNLGRDLLPESLFRYFFRKRWIKKWKMNEER